MIGQILGALEDGGPPMGSGDGPSFGSGEVIGEILGALGEMGSGEIGEMISGGGPPGRPGNKKALLKKLHKMMKAHQAREDYDSESESDDGPPFGSGEMIGQILGALEDGGPPMGSGDGPSFGSGEIIGEILGALGEMGSGEIGEMIGSGGPPGRPSRGPGNKKALLKRLHKMKKAHQAREDSESDFEPESDDGPPF